MLSFFLLLFLFLCGMQVRFSGRNVVYIGLETRVVTAHLMIVMHVLGEGHRCISQQLFAFEPPRTMESVLRVQCLSNVRNVWLLAFPAAHFLFEVDLLSIGSVKLALELKQLKGCGLPGG